MKMSRSKVIPVVVGSAKRHKATFIMGAPAESIVIPFIMFLVQTSDANVLVDTGVRDPIETPEFHGPYEQIEAQKPVKALASFGLRPDDIDIVINTHLHWDHCSNNQLFRKAKFYVQRQELRYAAAPLPAHAGYYDAFELGLIPSFVGTKFELLDGDEQIIDGISVLLTPGHTPGFQSVMVTSGERCCLIAGDNIPLYENLKNHAIADFKPSNIYLDLESYYRSIRRVLELGVPIIPGHDLALVGKKDLLS